MEQFEGRVAVVTGAASGIGRALASHCAAEGMKVVCADVERDAVVELARGLCDGGSEALAVVADVSQADHVNALADRTFDAMREDRFYILPPEGNGFREACNMRLAQIRTASNPGTNL